MRDKILLFAFIFFLFLGGLFGARVASRVVDEIKEFDFSFLFQEPDLDTGQYQVVRVIDGDTIELMNGEKVRYIGIDTPESVDKRVDVQCFGLEASQRNKELVEGKVVRLEKDISDIDQYGRLLRYVFVGDIFVNLLLVQEGYAFSSPYPPDVAYEASFLDAEREARDAGRGLWGGCDN